MKTFEDYSIEELERFRTIFVIIMVVAAVIALMTTWAFFIIALFCLIPISNCNRCINDKRQFEEYCSKIPDIKKQETKDILARRPNCDPNSKQYQDWATEYEESKLDKNIRYPEKHEDVFYQFKLEDMTFRYVGYIGNNKYADVYYITNAKYKEKFKNYLISINLILTNFNKNYPLFPPLSYSPGSLAFDETLTYTKVVCKFFHHPLTPTNKLAKYPYSIMLSFGDSDSSSFTLSFDKFGNAAKGEFVCWHNDVCYLLDAGVYNKEFQIVRAYRNDLGKKVKLFDIKEQ